MKLRTKVLIVVISVPFALASIDPADPMVGFRWVAGLSLGDWLLIAAFSPFVLFYAWMTA